MARLTVRRLIVDERGQRLEVMGTIFINPDESADVHRKVVEEFVYEKVDVQYQDLDLKLMLEHKGSRRPWLPRDEFALKRSSRLVVEVRAGVTRHACLDAVS